MFLRAPTMVLVVGLCLFIYLTSATPILKPENAVSELKPKPQPTAMKESEPISTTEPNSEPKVTLTQGTAGFRPKGYYCTPTRYPIYLTVSYVQQNRRYTCYARFEVGYCGGYCRGSYGSHCKGTRRAVQPSYSCRGQRVPFQSALYTEDYCWCSYR